MRKPGAWPVGALFTSKGPPRCAKNYEGAALVMKKNEKMFVRKVRSNVFSRTGGARSL
jgi:hypothetical protein